MVVNFLRLGPDLRDTPKADGLPDAVLGMIIKHGDASESLAIAWVEGKRTHRVGVRGVCGQLAEAADFPERVCAGVRDREESARSAEGGVNSPLAEGRDRYQSPASPDVP